MSAISLKSITGITSITTPAGVDNQLTLHTNNTTERVKIDVAGNVHVNNQLSVAGVTTFASNVFLGDDDNLYLGASNDLRIYHDAGAASHINAVGLVNIDGTTGVRLEYNNANRVYCTSSGVTLGGDIEIADKIVHEGDTNTAIRFPTNDVISFETSGSERFRINSNGDILTSGTSQLFGSNTSDGSDNKSIMINGGGSGSDTRGGYLLVHGNEHSSKPGITQLHAGNVGSAYIAFNTAGDERLRITSSGRANFKLDAGSTNNTYHIASEFNAKTSGSAAANFGPALYLSSTFGGTTYAGTVIASQTNADVHTSDLVFYPRNYTLFEGLRLASNGRVGIRTDNPGRELDVYKGTGNDCTIVARVRTAGAWFEANSEQSTGYYGLKLRHGNTEKWFLGSYGSHNLQLKTATQNVSSLLEITPSGNVGIGTNIMDSSADLSITNTGSARIYMKSGDSSDCSIIFGSLNDAATGAIRYDHSDDSFRFYGYNNDERLRIHSNGKVIIGTGTRNEETSTGALLIDRDITAESDAGDPNNFHLVLRSQTNSNTSKLGIGFVNTSDDNKIGAAILHRREGGGSVGSLEFHTSPSDGTITSRLTISAVGQVNIGMKNNGSSPNGNGTFTDVSLNNDGGDIATGRIYFQGYQKSANADYLTGINNEGASLVLYDYSNNHYKQKWHKNGGTELWHSSTNRLETTSSGVRMTGDLQVDGSGTSVTIQPTDGLINFGMDGRSSLVTGTNSCYIFSGSGSSGAMPAGSLVIQSRSNVNRDILFATGATPSLKWQIHGSTGALQEFPYNTSTSAQLTSTDNGYHLRRVRNGQVPTGTSGNEYTIFTTDTIADAGAYIMVIRSFEQSVTGGNLWSVRMVTSPFYIHSGSGNDGESVLIPYTYSGHANNATTQAGNGQGPITLRIHFYNGSAHTTGRIRIQYNGFNYTGSNCDYYLYKLIDV